MQIILIALTFIMVLATESHYNVIDTIDVYGINITERTSKEQDKSIPSNL